MVLDPLAIEVFGAITAKTVPVVLDFLGKQLKRVLESKRRKGKGELEALRNEVENLKRHLELKDTIGAVEIKQVEAQLEKAHFRTARFDPQAQRRELRERLRGLFQARHQVSQGPRA